MDPASQERKWFWLTMVLSTITIVAIVFACWELIEYRFFHDSNYVTLHYLYITRGVASSLLLAFWAAWYVLRQRSKSEEELRQSRERYRGLLDASPGAVSLYDTALTVSEWNAAAERLYGWTKAEVLGGSLPTLGAEQQEELRGWMRQVEAGGAILDVETLRRHRDGTTFEVQLSLLPFQEAAGSKPFFLEVTADIRERVRLRQTLLEVEKLTSMGKMAAGTAHHLNTPLAAMLLRLQMMRERCDDERTSAELERLEGGLTFCQHFVGRLLEFSRRAPAQKQPQELAQTIQSVISFLAPSVHTRSASVTLDVDGASGLRVLADRNQLEALFLILVSNALDAVTSGGLIAVRCGRRADSITVEIADNGCGILAADLRRIFEPFFTTKGPGKGTGLGLAIARNIVREHGGAIDVESSPGQGTTVLIELPLFQASGVKGSTV